MKIEKILESNNEPLLEELTWGESDASILNHYNKHVLQPGEPFDANNPKFAPMTKLEYVKNCDSFIKERCSTNFSDSVFGWLQYRPGDRDFTIVKFQKLKDGSYQKVVYEAFGTDFRNAYTYILYRGGLPRIQKQYNKQKSDGTWVSDLQDQSNFTAEQLEKFDEQMG